MADTNFVMDSYQACTSQDRVLSSQDLVLCIAKHVSRPSDLLRFSRVSRTWRIAAAHSALWIAQVAKTFGRLACMSMGAGRSPRQEFEELCTLHNVTCLTGWCEDHCTALGQPYTMDLHDLQPEQSRPSAVQHRTQEGRTQWAYANPVPRTRIKVVFCPIGREVWMKSGCVRVATVRGPGGPVLPLYSRRVSLREYAKLPGSGPVDVPTQYWAFRVGPALLGCFMPPQASLHILQLKSHDQKLGTFILWPKFLQEQSAALAAGRTPAHPCSVRCPCAGTPLCILHHSAQQQATMGHAAAPIDPKPSPTSSSRVQPQQQQQPSTSLPAGICCNWLRWQGLAPGSQLSGTVLTNFLVSSVTGGPRSGHAMLGSVQVWVTGVAPAPPSASPGPALRVQLLLHLPAREWVVDAVGLPVTAEPHEAAYSAPITCTATVQVTSSGRVHPVPMPPQSRPPQPPEPSAPGWAAPPAQTSPMDGACNLSNMPGHSSTRAEHGLSSVPGHMPAMVNAQAGAAAWPVGGEGGPAERPAWWDGTVGDGTAAQSEVPDVQGLDLDAMHMQIVLAAALQLSNAPGAAHPSLVDRWPAQLQGQVAGGVLMAVVSHPVAGRAVMCVSEGGLGTLCPQWN